MFLASIAFAAVTRWPRLTGGDRGAIGADPMQDPETSAKPLTRNAVIAGHVFAALTAILAILATIWIIRTGHEGARITWDPAGTWADF